MDRRGLGHSFENQVPRVAMIGLGHSARHILLPALKTLGNIEIVAGCDPDAETRIGTSRKWNIPRIYTTAGEMLDTEHPDVAVIATPPLTHSGLCVLALEHGCHVFCEKPFTPSVEDAGEVINAAHSTRLSHDKLSLVPRCS